MNRILSYPLSIIYYFFFGLNLTIFHFIQWICLKLGGYSWHKKSVDWMCLINDRLLWLLFNHVQFVTPKELPVDKPYIIVSNHQSLYDIGPIIWNLRKLHPKFISKKELGKGIPSVSFNLRHGGSVLIDRKDSEASSKAILQFAKKVKANKWAAVIFPEGTRSRNGEPKDFHYGGLLSLLKIMPEAYVLPISINNSWKILKNGMYPLGIGIRMRFDAHAPLELADFEEPMALIQEVERRIKIGIYQT